MDLTVVNIKASGGAATIPATRRSSIVGQQVTGPIAAGTLLSPSSVAPGPQLGPGEVGIAPALDPDRAAQGSLCGRAAPALAGRNRPRASVFSASSMPTLRWPPYSVGIAFLGARRPDPSRCGFPSPSS
jgi:hypothetical protein